MTDPNPSEQTAPDPERPNASSDAASAPARSGFTLRGRRWIYGATLAAAGVLAGGGVTYAVVSAVPTQSQTAPQDGSGQRGGPMGAPPGGHQGGLPDSQAPDGPPSGAPSTGTGETT